MYRFSCTCYRYRQNPHVYVSIVNCLPNSNNTNGFDVNIEYELNMTDLKLQDLTITIPLPFVFRLPRIPPFVSTNKLCLRSTYHHYINVNTLVAFFAPCSTPHTSGQASAGAPVVSSCDGDYRLDAKHSQLVWSVPLVDANRQRTGALEFSIAQAPGSSADVFFPLSIQFHSSKPFCDIAVRDWLICNNPRFTLSKVIPPRMWSSRCLLSSIDSITQD